MNSHLHIVCLDAPSPPDYGGAIDMYYKVKALVESGKKITLHYFDYNPLRHAKGLEEVCEAIYTYKRKSIFKTLPLSQPFIVQSRINNELIERLNQDDFPVLLEGLHCSGIIPFLDNKERVVLRMHNEEASYYQHLAAAETNFLKRKYFQQETRLLQAYQHKLDKRVKLACLSQTDLGVFRNKYQFENLHFIPCFIAWQILNIQVGKGDFCLYHGNMSVSENEEAALWLLKNVFGNLPKKFVIAGKGISMRLTKEAGRYKNISLVNNPSIDQVDQMIREAQINVLPSMNNTGVKLKLLNALLNGRHCITNYNGVKGSDIEETVIVKEDANDWIQSVRDLMTRPFTSTDIENRKPFRT